MPSGSSTQLWKNDPFLDAPIIDLLNIEMFHSYVEKPEGIPPALFTGHR